MSDIKNQISDLFDNLTPDDTELISEEMNIKAPTPKASPKPQRVVEERSNRIPIRGPVKRTPQRKQVQIKEEAPKKKAENYFDKLILHRPGYML